MNDDLISRKAAVNALEELMELDYERYVRLGHSRLTEDDWECLINNYKEIVKSLPNVEPKTGQWQYKNTTRWDAKDKDGEQQLEISIVSASCSVCGRWAEQVNNFPPYMQYNYCPHCGAKMEVTK